MVIETLIVLFGLFLFELISSIDNAIINIHILKTLSEKQRKFFLSFGALLTIVVTRGLLPILIIWIANPFFSLTEILFLIVVVGGDLRINPILAVSATIGALLFFVLDGLKKIAEAKQKSIFSLQ